VADFFEKRHDHVLRDIDNLLKSLDSPKLGSAFTETTRVDGQGISRRAYNMTRDGFTPAGHGIEPGRAFRYIPPRDNPDFPTREKHRSGATLGWRDRYRPSNTVLNRARKPRHIQAGFRFSGSRLRPV
jgi:hypothetical protein